MAFVKGQSGNPKGRPRSSQKIACLRDEMVKDAKAVLQKLKEKALSGDTQAIRLWLERTVPPMKPEDRPVYFSLPEGSLAEQGEAVFRAAAMGEITPAQASAMTATLASVARIKEISEMEERIRKLEAERDKDVI